MSEKHLKTGDANPPVNPDVLRIYSMRYCPFVARVLLVLATKGIECEVVNCNLLRKPEFLLERNPAGSVPVLEYKGHVIPESMVLVNLLEDLFPDAPRVTAVDPFQKAEDTLVMDKFGKAIAGFYTFYRNKSKTEAKDAIGKGMAEFEAKLIERQTPFFGGDQCGLVDLMAWPFVERIVLLDPLTLKALPTLKAWYAGMEEVPAVKKCAEPGAKIIDFYKGYFVDDPSIYEP